MANQINILVAEDDTNIALALKTIIRKATGGNVIVVNDGQEAIDRLQQAARPQARQRHRRHQPRQPHPPRRRRLLAPRGALADARGGRRPEVR